MRESRNELEDGECGVSDADAIKNDEPGLCGVAMEVSDRTSISRGGGTATPGFTTRSEPDKKRKKKKKSMKRTKRNRRRRAKRLVFFRRNALLETKNQLKMYRYKRSEHSWPGALMIPTHQT